MSEKTSFFKVGPISFVGRRVPYCRRVLHCRRMAQVILLLFPFGRFEQIDFAAFDLAVHVGQFGDHRRDEFERVGDGRLFAFALDAVEHGGVQGPEAQLRVFMPGLPSTARRRGSSGSRRAYVLR